MCCWTSLKTPSVAAARVSLSAARSSRSADRIPTLSRPRPAMSTRHKARRTLHAAGTQRCALRAHGLRWLCTSTVSPCRVVRYCLVGREFAVAETAHRRCQPPPPLPLPSPLLLAPSPPPPHPRRPAPWPGRSPALCSCGSVPRRPSGLADGDASEITTSGVPGEGEARARPSGNDGAPRRSPRVAHLQAAIACVPSLPHRRSIPPAVVRRMCRGTEEAAAGPARWSVRRR
jgi:hypothetical protein